MLKNKILIADVLHPNLRLSLLEKRINCDVVEDISSKDLLENINQYTGLVIRSRHSIDHNFIDKGKNLIFIARAGSGTENIDVSYAHSKGIKIISSPEANARSVAEHTLGMILSLINKFNKSSSEINKGVWDRNTNWGNTLKDKTVGIIGFGHTGSALAKLLMGFDVNILVYDKYKHGFETPYIKEVSLEVIRKHADIVSIHIPLNKDNQYYINQAFVTSFSKPIMLINTSRGKILKIKDLLYGLKNNFIKSAGLDVLEYENKDFESIFTEQKDLQQLLKMTNVLITPHVAGWTEESYQLHSEVLAKKIIKALS